jgi:glycerol-3-phosphate O-acyltransferase/dihydroxyacetone phosphate acyltransferase
LGIFPEGGSHDNTDLLPLKVGVAAIAFGVLEKYDVNVPIVPVGLNYFRGHRFRGRVVVEFGQPIYLDKKLIQLYRDSKRKAYRELLTSVRLGLELGLV